MGQGSSSRCDCETASEAVDQPANSNGAFTSVADAFRIHSSTTPYTTISNTQMPLEKLRAAYLDSHSQKAVILGQLEVLDADADIMDRYIEGLQAQLTEAKGRKAQLDITRCRHHALLSPVWLLPVELWNDIFELSICASTSELSPGRDWLLSLGQVCNRWRNVVLNSPRLWAMISIEGSLSLLKYVWIPRSQQLPLDIAVSLPVYRRDGDAGEISSDATDRELLNIFVAVSERWCNVRIFLPMRHLEYLASLQPSLPSLESLDLEVFDTDPSWRPTPDAFGAFMHTSQLRSLKARGILPKSLQLSFSTLQYFELEMTPLPMDDIHLVLSLCPQLLTFDVTVLRTSNKPAARLKHTSLQQLTLHDSGSGRRFPILRLLSTLALPSLESLTFEGWEMAWSQGLFSLFCQTSLCTIRCLSIGGTSMSSDEIIECFSGLPFLESVALLDALEDTGKPLFERLTAHPGGHTPELDIDTSKMPCILLFLEHFALRSLGDSFDESSLIAMVDSRLHDFDETECSVMGDSYAIRVPLMSVEVYCRPSMDAFAAKLDEWRDCELDVELDYFVG